MLNGVLTDVLTDMLTPVRWLLRSLLLLVLLIPGLPVALLCSNRLGQAVSVQGQGLDQFMLKTWATAFCRVFGVRTVVHGTPEPAPVLVVANHISWLDIMALYGAANMGFVSKAEVARWPLVSYLARLSGTVYHQRGSHHSAQAVSTLMSERLAQGHRIAIFPEGGISAGDHVKMFHARLFKAAVDAQCTVQPVMLRYVRNGQRDTGMTFGDGEHFMVNFLRLLGRPSCHCELNFLPAIETADQPRKALAQAAHEVVSAAFQAPV